MFKGKKVIIFDMDGTLIDSVGIWNEIDEKLIKAIGDGTIDDINIQVQRDTTLKKFASSEDAYLEYCRFLKNKYKSDMEAEDILNLRYKMTKDYIENVVCYKKDAEKVLCKLKELGFKLAIGTTTHRANIDSYKTVNKNIIRKANLDDFFEIILAKEDVTKSKPDPEVHEKIMEFFDVKPEDCLIVEDALLGVEAAKNAGIDVITIYDEYSDFERKEINQISKYNFKTFEEMLDYINKEIENN